MRHMSQFALVVVLACLLSACGSASASTPPKATPTFTPIAQPTLPVAGIAQHAVTFTTSDGDALVGTLYGHGDTGVIFSTMLRASEVNWRPTAQQFAARGYLALTYNYRGTNGSSGTFDTGKLPLDLTAAIGFMRQQHVRHLVLMGASIGGATTLITAGTIQVDGIAVLSGLSTWPDLQVTPEMLRGIKCPKLFVYSAYDDIAQDMHNMYEEAAPPKDEIVYSGADHGTVIFEGEHGPYLLERLLAFTSSIGQGT